MKNKFLKISLFLVIFIVFGFFIFRNLGEIRTTFDVTVSSLTSWIMLAFVIGIISFVFNIMSDKKSFEMVKIRIPFKRMLRLNLSALATNTLIPSAGVSGGLVFVEDAKDHNYNASSAVAGHILYIVSDYTAITVLLISSLLYLFITKTLITSIYIPVGVFFLLTFSFDFLLFLSARDSKIAKKIIAAILVPVFWLIGFFTKKKNSSHDSVDVFFKELCFASKVIKSNPSSLMQSVGWAVLNHVTKLLSLYLLFYSFGYHIKPSVLLAGYIIGIVVMVVSPTPNGIGFVEGSMVIIFAALGVPRELATTATLIYRGYAFWIPFFIGLLMLQTNRIKKIRTEMGDLNAG